MNKIYYYKILFFVTIGIILTNEYTAQTDSVVINFTGSQQTFTVPCGINSIKIKAYGAQGGNGALGTDNISMGGIGGLGAFVSGTLNVTPGQLLYLQVGGSGSAATGGYNGGGNAGNQNAGGGGGATDVRLGGTTAANRILVAGGGGGGGRGGNVAVGGNGGDAGGGNGQNGADAPNTGGGGGFVGGGQGAIGVVGGVLSMACLPGNSGVTAIDENGASGGFGLASGGGGGGGYLGGGGGSSGGLGTVVCAGNDISGGGGGAGGTNYLDVSFTNVITQNGVNMGNGKIIILWDSLIVASPVFDNAPNPVCVGTTKTYDLILDASVTSYTWSYSSGIVPVDPNNTTNATDAIVNMDGTITVVAHDVCNNSSLPTSLNITGLNNPVITFTALVDTLCPESSAVNLEALPLGGTFSGIGVSGNQFTPNINITGNNVITYTYTDPSGCIGIAEDSINVLEVIFTAPVDTVCNQNGAIDLMATPIGGIFSGTGILGSQFVPSANIIGNNIITYTYMHQSGCIVTKIDSIYVIADPVVTFTAPVDTVCSESAAINLVATPANGIFSGTGISGNQFVPSVNLLGQNFITYTYTDQFTCVGTAMDSIYVKTCDNAGVKDLTNSFFTIYPNPSDGIFTISLSKDESCKVSIFDESGRLVKEMEVKKKDQFIDIHNEPEGIYRINVTKDNQTQTRQIIKIK